MNQTNPPIPASDRPPAGYTWHHDQDGTTMILVEYSIHRQYEAGKILFSVTPISSKYALEQIKKALDIYLQLPVHFPQNHYLHIHVDRNVQQLMANIQHLNGQLMLINATVQR